MSPATKTSYAFYHWKSSYEVAKGNVQPRYVKVLDITFHNSLEIRKTTFKQEPSTQIVPVIYLDNSVWKKMKALTMVQKVLSSLKAMPMLKAYNEIQVDCDWTDSSQDSYFEFLKELKKQSSKKISVTIRLHQVKYYHKTGVPPVDYGVLMYYNMSDFKSLETKNYILDLDVAKRYHYNFESYPLPLNLALPLYAQATIIRFGEVVGIMEGLREKELNANFKKIAEHFFEVTKTHYLNNRLLYEGDQLRIDEVSLALLEESLGILRKVMKQPQEIIFYRWGNLSFYGEENLRRVVQTW